VAAPADSGTKVITGHYGIGAGAKSLDRRAPVWCLLLATQWLDVVFIPLFLLGIETIEMLPGGGYGGVVIHADYTHSLLGALVLSAGFGAVAWWRWDRRLGLLSRSRIGCSISSCTAETCQSCRATPAIFRCLASGYGECRSCRFRWRRCCFSPESSFTDVPQGRWDRDPAAGSPRRLLRRLYWCLARLFSCSMRWASEHGRDRLSKIRS
jgi:hypothetical protein